MTLLFYFIKFDVSMLGMIWVLLTPHGRNYLHLSESIRLEIVHIVSIKCIIRAGTGT